MSIRLKRGFLFLLTLLLYSPGSAWAFQSHPAPEGLYVHQLAHLFFILAMGILAYWLQFNRFTREKGWRLIQVSCVLFILWNLVAFSGHWVEEKIPNEVFLGDPDWTQRIMIKGNNWAYLYYVLKLDHLVSVPAMVCLCLGIRSLYKRAVSEEQQTDG